MVDPMKEYITICVMDDEPTQMIVPFSELAASAVVKGLTLNLGKLLQEHDAQF